MMTPSNVLSCLPPSADILTAVSVSSFRLHGMGIGNPYVNVKVTHGFTQSTSMGVNGRNCLDACMAVALFMRQGEKLSILAYGGDRWEFTRG